MIFGLFYDKLLVVIFTKISVILFIMSNPTLSQKKENTLTLTENAKKLFQAIYSEQNKEETAKETPKIKVSELISKMAFYYEKIRNTVDYKEESLLRKNAIERILRRQIVLQGAKDEEKIAGHLLVELIRAGYLPNNKIEESKIGEISGLIGKYIALKNYCAASQNLDYKDKNGLTKWIMAMAACDIEERLGGGAVRRLVINAMYDILRENVKLPEDLPYEKDKEIQIYIGIHRNYLKNDKEMIEFILFKYFNTDWHKTGEEEIKRTAEDIIALRGAIDRQYNHPLAGQLNKIISRYTVYFTIFTDVVEDDPAGTYEKIFSDAKAFPRLVKKFCEKRYKAAASKLRRAALRSILYIFLTKMVLALILEIPFTLWLGQQVNNTSLAINVAFPPFLLFLIVMLTNVPSEANTAKIVEGVEEIAFKEQLLSKPFLLKKPSTRSRAMSVVFGLIYTVTFLLSFGFVVWTLLIIHFNIISIIIFLFFLTLVSFFSIRIRRVARELVIIETKENIISFIADFFYVPIIEVGKWLNEHFSRLNVLVFILDFIIEAPFKIFVEITEEWTKYVKERKDEIV